MQRCEKFLDMTNCGDGWSRLEQVVNWTGLSINQFARQIGLLRPDNIYHIKSGKIGVSQNLVRRIVAAYPEVSPGWLLTGEGSMLGADMGGNIPYFECDVTRLMNVIGGEGATPQMLKISFMEGGDCAWRSYDGAMAPEVMPGMILFLKKIDFTAIIPGGIHVVVTTNFVLLRRIRIEGDAPSRRFVLEAKAEGYDDVSVEEADVEAVYKLMGTMKMC